MLWRVSMSAGLVVLVGVLAACGQREASVLDTAFEREIESAQMRVEVRLTEGPRRDLLEHFSLRGPFRRNGEAKLASFDWLVSFAGHHGEQFTARVISTGENVFVRHRSRTYEVGEREIARLNRQAARQQASGGGQVEDLDDVRRLGVDLRKWFPKSDSEADEQLGSEQTTRVTGRLDVSTALRDFARLMRHPALARRPEMKGLPRLSARDIAEIDKTISDPRFDVHVAQSDGKFRRIGAKMRFKIPPQQREKATFGELTITVDLENVDKPVQIDAPDSGRPIEQLLRKLGAVAPATA